VCPTQDQECLIQGIPLSGSVDGGVDVLQFRKAIGVLGACF
jgi:hypothetical protein